ncbi:hypothetical protein ABT320_15570 [Streptomyces cellulosae]
MSAAARPPSPLLSSPLPQPANRTAVAVIADHRQRWLFVVTPPPPPE